jgi:hypothetical protein
MIHVEAFKIFSPAAAADLPTCATLDENRSGGENGREVYSAI